jgi:serine/threonine protein kinase
MRSVEEFASLYMAPEVSEGDCGPKVDVYSFGFILYEIIVGNGLLSSEGDKGQLLNDLRKGWRPIDTIGKEVSDVMKGLIERCWSSNPNFRPSFSEIWEELKKLDFQLIVGANTVELRHFAQIVEEQNDEKDLASESRKGRLRLRRKRVLIHES